MHEAVVAGDEDAQLLGGEQVLAAVEDLFEHGRGVGHRTADHLQDFRGGCLPLQGCLGFVEQPHVFDGDHGLVGEGLDQVDLRRCEWTYLIAKQRDQADRLTVAQHRHREHGAKAVAFLERADVGILGVDERQYVFDMDAPPFQERPAADRGLAHGQHIVVRIGSVGGPIARHRAQLRADDEPDPAAFGTTQLAGAFGKGVEHRLHVGRRTADDFQDFGSRGLALQRLLRLVEQAHVLDRDHGLVGEGLQQRDLLRREGARLAAPGKDRADRLAFTKHRHRKHCARADAQ